VSHNMASVQNLCQKAIVLNHGMVEFSGDCETGIQRYLQQNISTTDFRNLPGRRGKGPVRISGIRIYGDGEGIQPIMGKKLVIEITLENNYNISSKDIVLDIDIEDFRGNKLVWLSTYLLPCKKNSVLKKITFEIDPLMLNHGKYLLSFDMSVNKVLADALYHAIVFEVNDADFFKNSKKIPDNKSKVLNHFTISYD